MFMNFYLITFTLETLIVIFDVKLIYKCLKKKKILKTKRKSRIMSYQEKVNKIFESPSPRFYKKYATLNYLFRTMILFLLNYPIGPLLLFFFILLKFQVDKFVILKLNSQPKVRYHGEVVKSLIKDSEFIFLFIIMRAGVVKKFGIDRGLFGNPILNILFDFVFPSVFVMVPWEKYFEKLFGDFNKKVEDENNYQEIINRKLFDYEHYCKS